MESQEKTWRRVHSEQGPELIIFSTRFDWYENPRNGIEFKRVVLEASDWVNVVAITERDTLLLVRQFRFGVAGETTEIPAGMVDAGEEPEHAARRELEEETGFTGGEWTSLGWVYPNPAFLNNRVHTYLARDVKRTAEPRPDEGEDIIVVELTRDAIVEAVRDGRIRNALAVVALSRVFDLRSG